jgi:peptide/nickel transport system substrate-binding protein
VESLDRLVNRGLSIADDQGQLRPQIAEDVPTVENGLWKVLPGGRMETTWTLRPGVAWHDGEPLTADDLLFTTRVDQDRDLPFRQDRAYASIDGITAPDARTLVVTWKQPYVRADSFLSGSVLPRHLLERPYEDNKAGFPQLTYWQQDYIGVGPYRVKEWELGSHAIFSANPSFVLGRPKIDELEVRFVADANTFIANVLAGAVDMNLGGRSLSVDQALEARNQWRNGRVEVDVAAWIVAFPQFLNPNPSVIGDVRFRQALIHALDREQMAESIQAGLAPVAHSNIPPNEREYRDIEKSIVRYDFDPRRAAQLIESMGYVKGPNGTYRDAADRPLTFEARSQQSFEVSVKAMLAAADGWQRVGLAVEQYPIPQQLDTDLEFRANFPGLMIQRQPANFDNMARYHSREVPRAENGYRGESKNRYSNPELDELIDRVYVTIPWGERMAILGNIVHHMTDQLIAIGLFHDSSPSLINNRLLNVTPRSAGWNVHEWEVKD